MSGARHPTAVPSSSTAASPAGPGPRRRRAGRARPSLFTGRLLELLDDGDPAGPLWLTADRLHAVLDEALAEDGRLPAGAGEDGTVRLGSVADPEPPHLAHTFGGHREGVDEVVLGGPDGRTMVTTSAGFAYVVDLGACPAMAADALGTACRAVGRGFTRDEWEEQVPEAAAFAESCPDGSAHDTDG
ncbi:hypothetical protein [Streptomyces fungicidicus]|uniref:hypothetical protein n=1 Tax=Streptomyces fungicidicus TaxID=68203 RepID=UPI003669D31C